MATIAEEVARTFARFQPLEAYRLDILGSLAGIVAFTALSFLQLPPLAWGLVAAAGFVVLLGDRARRWQWAGLGVVVLLLGVQSLLPLYHWSPYNKVRATERPAERALSVSANNVPHQVARPVEGLRTAAPFYFFPYRHLPAGDLDEVLVIGTGTGNDVAVALAMGPGTWTRSRSTRPSSAWDATATPTAPTSTRASAPTSTTAGRSWIRPTSATTWSCSP
jgi:hypothetical protein